MSGSEHDGSQHAGGEHDDRSADGGPAEDRADTGGPAEDAEHGGGVRDASAHGGGGGAADSTAGGPAREPLGEGGADKDSDAAAPVAAGASAGSATSASATAASGPTDPSELLGEVRAIRRRARLARHAYWFPLVLFGLLISASTPFYLPPTRSGAYYPPPGPRFLQSLYLGGFGPASFRGTAYYWLGAMLFGIGATVLWYRWRGNRVGLRTPARGYLITGLIIVALALLLPVIAQHVSGLPLFLPGDVLIRGTFPLVLIGLGLCFLAWSERSVGLAVVAAVYLGLALLASLYDIENVFYNWFGWSLSAPESALPNLLLPALVLLLSGAGAWAVQRRHQRRAKPEPAAG